MPPVAVHPGPSRPPFSTRLESLLARARDTESVYRDRTPRGRDRLAPVAARAFGPSGLFGRSSSSRRCCSSCTSVCCKAYRTADLSFVYPSRGGVAPAVVLVVSVLALGQATSAAQVAGCCLVCAGVLFRARTADSVRSTRALVRPSASPCVIASYQAARQARHHARQPVTYLELAVIPAALGYALAVFMMGASHGHAGGAEHGVDSCRVRVVSQRTHSSWPRSNALPRRRWRQCARRAS